MEIASMINSAYIKQNFNVTVMTGFNYFPFKFDVHSLLPRVTMLLSVVMVPCCLVLGFPVFMLAIVHEKERRLVEIMKINGMQMNNYWLVNYVFFYIFYLIVLFVFLFFGKYIFKFTFFVNTSLWVQFVLFNGWGLA